MFVRAIQIFAGLVLLTAAGLKLHGWFLGVSQIPLPPLVIMFGWQLEILIGAWLLAGIQPRVSLTGASLFFVALAGVNGWLLNNGASGCGCLGAVSAKPLAMLIFDLIVAIALGFAAFKSISQRTESEIQFSVNLLYSLISLIVFAVVMGGWFFVQTSPALAAALNTDDISIADVNIGAVDPRARIEIRIPVRNDSLIPVSLIGAKSSCRLKFNRNYPIEIPPGQTVEVRASFQAPTTAGSFRNRYVLYCDVSSSLFTNGWIAGRVLPVTDDSSGN